MSRRLLLHEELCNVLGSRNVYFKPPESNKIQYPCIMYSLADIPITHADNANYLAQHQYQIIVIDPDPDSPVVDRMSYFPNTRFDRHYADEHLNYYVFTKNY